MRRRSIFISTCLLTALSLFNSSCKDENKYKNEIAQLDSMLLNLVKVTADSSFRNTAANDSLIANIQEDLKVVDTLLPDTLTDKQLAILLMEYRSLQTPLKQCPLRLQQLQLDAEESNKRITDLKNDLKKDIAEEKLAKTFVEAERTNTNVILTSYTLLNSMRDSIFKRADADKEMIKGKIHELRILKTEKKKHTHLR